jgi:Fur family transcriptional regulator, iron response regulator
MAETLFFGLQASVAGLDQSMRLEAAAANGYSSFSRIAFYRRISSIQVMSATTPHSHDAHVAPRSGCPMQTLKSKLREAGLRPTRQRVALGWMMFGKGDRHLSAENLYEEAIKARVPVSLATVYNTLHQFKEAGLLRQVAMDGTKAYFDTNTSDHHHFYIEGEDRMIDIPGLTFSVGQLPPIPEGMEIAHVDVVVRLRKKV